MRTIVNCLIVLLLFQSQKVEAAATPPALSYVLPTLDTTSKDPQILISPAYVPHKKAGFIKKLQYKILQKRLKYLSNKYEEGTPSKKNVLSIISLIAGLLVVIGVVANAGILALIAALVAVITGIIALGRRNNNTKGSRAMAIIGLVLGAAYFFLVLVAVAFWSAFFNWG